MITPMLEKMRHTTYSKHAPTIGDDFCCLSVFGFIAFLNRLTNDRRESVLIIDDSPYDPSRSKRVELLSRVFDHSTGRYLKGFRLLTICWSDGVSCLPLDFTLLSSAKKKNRFHESNKSLDKRCCAFRRRTEAITKATMLLAPMLKRILKAGINVRYVLMDS